MATRLNAWRVLCCQESFQYRTQAQPFVFEVGIDLADTFQPMQPGPARGGRLGERKGTSSQGHRSGLVHVTPQLAVGSIAAVSSQRLSFQ
jgi:hypothetical protein